jgi:hypothetical protein
VIHVRARPRRRRLGAGARQVGSGEAGDIVIQRVWQAFLSFLALGGFFALEFLRGRDVGPLALVVCSWVTIVAPVLLAILWVTKRQYFRTFVLALLVAATRVSLEDSLSEFMRLAAWFLVGAIVLALILALVVRWLKKGTTPERSIPPESRAVSPPSVQERQAPAVEPTPAKTSVDPESLTPVAYMAVACNPGPDGAGTGCCGNCGTAIADDQAEFCSECGASLT